MDEKQILALILTTIAGLATLVGGMATFFIRKDNLKALSIGLGFSAGVMIFIALTEILRESQEFLTTGWGDKARALAFVSFFTGIFIAKLIDHFLPAHIDEELIEEKNLGLKENNEDNELTEKTKRAGILTAIAISIHRFPEGMATFFIASSNLTLGIPLAIAIAIHNFPEGIAIALPVYNSTGRKRVAIWYSFVAGLAGPIGAIIGFSCLQAFLSQTTIGVLFGIVAGIMIYISLDTLLPLAREYGDNHNVIFGIISGMFFIAISLLLF